MEAIARFPCANEPCPKHVFAQYVTGSMIWTSTSRARYMGWVRKYLADGDAVHGVIAARKVDEKLMAARDAHDTKVHLIEFEMKVSAKAL